MSLDDSISSIMSRLAQWSRFPKYQLERRIDIFLTPFLESFVSAQLTRPARLVAPEFPILSELAKHGAKADRATLSCSTVNVDYLLHVPGPEAEWLFLELKTDCSSFRQDQADRYAIARDRGMGQLLGDLRRVLEKTEATEKYQALHDALPAIASEGEPIHIAYLAPEAVREEALRLGSADRRIVDHFFSLHAFANMDVDVIPPEHRALWPYVRDLLRAIDLGPRAGRRA
jgi:hypothetical protein